MMTLLPYADFYHSVHCLDKVRLSVQRIETLQLLSQLKSPHRSPISPVAKMWKDYIPALENYGCHLVEAWKAMGYGTQVYFKYNNDAPLPHWIGDDRLHSSHRALLLYRDKWFYAKYNWKEEPKAEIWWPE